MKKIYWIVNQLNIDDASISAIEIANRLVQYRSVSIIVLGSNLNVDSNVSGKIDIIYLDIDNKNYELDNLSSYFKTNKKELKERISELTTKNDIIISTSFLSSYIVPKGRRFLYYYLGNKEAFLSFKEKQKRKKHRVPDNFIFTSEKLKESLDKKKKYRGSYQIFPCSTLYPLLDLNSYNNTISYVYSNGDDYLLPINLAIKLKENGINYKFNYYANDEILKKINGIIVENGLNKIINRINEYELSNVFKQCDLFISVDKKNSIPLLVVEAFSQGKPIIGFNNEATGEGNSIIIDLKNINNTISEVKELFVKQKRLEKFKQNAFNSAFRYSKDMIVAKWLDILEIEDNLIHKE